MIQGMRILSKVRQGAPILAKSGLKVIRAILRFISLLLRSPVCLIHFVPFSNRQGVATILLAGLAISIVSETFLAYPPLVKTSICIGIGALEILPFRAFLWIYRPERRIKSFIVLGVVFDLLMAVFRLADHAIRKSTDSEANGKNIEGKTVSDPKQKSERQLRIIRILLSTGRSAKRLVPQTGKQLYPILMASWLVLTVLVVLVFAMCFYSFSEIEQPVLEIIGNSGSFLHFLGASLAVFTTAPVSTVYPLDTWGLSFCDIEITDALLLLGLFLAMLIRLVPHDSAKGLEKLEETWRVFRRI